MAFNKTFGPTIQQEMQAPHGVVNIRNNKTGQTKQYSTVALRIKTFWDDKTHEGWRVNTQIIQITPEAVVMRCDIYDNNDRLIATGHSEEWRGASDINSTSALENGETSAIGRALAALGIGGESFASAEEVHGAIGEQDRLTHIRELYLPTFEDAACLGFEVLSNFYEKPFLDSVTEQFSTEDIRRALIKEMPRLKRLAEEADAKAMQEMSGNQVFVEEDNA